MSRIRRLTSAAIDAREFLRTRETEKIKTEQSEGALVAVAGSKPVNDAMIYAMAVSVRNVAVQHHSSQDSCHPIPARF